MLTVGTLSFAKRTFSNHLCPDRPNVLIRPRQVVIVKRPYKIIEHLIILMLGRTECIALVRGVEKGTQGENVLLYCYVGTWQLI